MKFDIPLDTVFVGAIGLLSFLIVIVVYNIVAYSRLQVSGRLRLIQKVEAEEMRVEEAPKLKIRRARESSSIIGRYSQRLASRLEKAHLLYRPIEFVLISLISAVVFAGLGLIRMRSLIGLILGGVAGIILPNIYLSFRERRQKALLSGQIGDMLLLLANYLRAGHAFQKAMEIVSREVPSPLADELRKFAKDTALGTPINQALMELEQRTEDDDLGLAITAVLIQHEVGGNLAEILDNINYTIRERVRLKGEIRTLTTQGRMSAWILTALPFLIGSFIMMASPSYIVPLISTPEGYIMLAGAAVAEIVGILVIRKIIQIQV